MAEYQLKDSGVEWLGDIPEHWQKGRLKFQLSKINSGVTPKGGATSYVDRGIPLIRSQNVKNSGLDLSNAVFIKDAVHQKMNNSKVISGDVLLNITGASIGRCAVVNDIGEANVNQHVCILRSYPWVAARFIYYFLLSDIGQSQIYSSFTGSGREGLSFESIKKFRFPIIISKEQKAIADYLDKACKQIDKTLEIKQQQLEKLESYRKSIIHEAVTKGLDKNVTLKGSGVNLFGDIPDSWRMQRIKGIVKIKITDGPHETPMLVDSGIPFISAESIKNHKIDFNKRRGFISRELHDIYSKKCKPQKFDIFVIKSGATTGNVAYVDTDLEFNIWSPLALIRCNESLAHYKFMYYQFLGDVFRKQVELAWSFGTQENIGMGVLGRIKISLPSVKEQKIIAEYLDKTCLRIDQTKALIEQQIKTLTNYRKSLIHECVTGKKRVYFD